MSLCDNESKIKNKPKLKQTYSGKPPIQVKKRVLQAEKWLIDLYQNCNMKENNFQSRAAIKIIAYIINTIMCWEM